MLFHLFLHECSFLYNGVHLPLFKIALLRLGFSLNSNSVNPQNVIIYAALYFCLLLVPFCSISFLNRLTVLKEFSLYIHDSYAVGFSSPDGGLPRKASVYIVRLHASFIISKPHPTYLTGVSNFFLPFPLKRILEIFRVCVVFRFFSFGGLFNLT